MVQVWLHKYYHKVLGVQQTDCRHELGSGNTIFLSLLTIPVDPCWSLNCGKQSSREGPTCRAEVVAAGVLELGLVQQLVQRHRLLAVQVPGRAVAIHAAAHLRNQPPCRAHALTLEEPFLGTENSLVAAGMAPQYV